MKVIHLALLLGLTWISASGARALAATVAPASTPAATLIVLDASGSMRERIKGQTKVDIAKRAVRELVNGLPDDTHLGLVVYSHRKNTCDDIELLIPPAKLDKAAFIRAVEAIDPKGRTPLSASLKFAAEALNHTKNRANIVLVSDGLETCGENPCETARKLEQLGFDIAVHAVAFDLTAKEAKTISCIAAETGGRFLQANDAATLKDALQVAVAETAAPPAPQPPAEDLTPATLKVPPEIPVGAVFPVEWTGPKNPGDFITIVPKGAPDDDSGNLAYARQGSPLELTALLEPGDAEVRYLAGRSRKILGRAPTKLTKVEITLAAAAEATAGSSVAVTWSGPNNEGDFITIVPRTAEEGVYVGYAYTRDGSPLNIAAPIEAGDAEIRYMSGQGRKSLARRPIKINAASATLSAPDEITAGGAVAIAWTGPNNDGDFLTIVPRNSPDAHYVQYGYTRDGSPLSVAAPVDAGDGEIRYMSGRGTKVLARRPIKVLAATATLSAPDEAIAGSMVSVTWTGPGNDGDYLTIVPKSAPDSEYTHYAYTRQGSTLGINAPADAGDCEIRYLTQQGPKVLARRPILILAAKVTLSAPDEAIAGSAVSVTWTGPGNDGDYLTIVPKSAEPTAYANYTHARTGSPLEVTAPLEPGECEVRYISGVGPKLLERRPIRIVAAQITLKAAASVRAGSEVAIEWTGPNHAGDFITIVPKSAADGVYADYMNTAVGSPLEVAAPRAAGPAEVRYMSGQGNKVLARFAIEITAGDATTP